MRNSSNLQLNPFIFSLYSSHLDYQMQIIYRILLANPFSAPVGEIPDTFQKSPVLQLRGASLSEVNGPSEPERASSL